MASTIYVGLIVIICLSRSIEIAARAEWANPPFLEAVPKDKAIRSFKYVSATGRANIGLEEEVEYDVCIALLNYEDTPCPSIGPLEEDKSNYVLGAVIKPPSDENKYCSLWITRKQDFETPIMQDYRFPIFLDSDTYMIALNIENVDDNPPVIRAIEKNCIIEENYSGLSNCTYLVSDADGWIQETTIDLSSVPEGNNFRFVNETGENPDYERKLHLYVTKRLDFESISMYMLLIRATDGAKNNGSLETVVEVKDMPDELPFWTRISAVENILEKSTKTFNVSAMDGDVQINATINYRIHVDDEKDTGYFKVDKQTGLITINAIDRDERKQEIFRFIIIAYEVPEPDSSINATIVVMVEDINDHAPLITPNADILVTKIDEAKYGTLEFESPIEINDPDLAENAQFSVSLTDESAHNWSSAFLILPTSGYQHGIFTISVANATLLDYEDENWRNIDLQLLAIEVGYETRKNISIKLLDWNDELPIFDEKTPSSVSVREDVEEFYTIATVHATDRDFEDKVLKHSLVAQRTLTIDEKTGEIKTNRADALDYESMRVVVVQVVATDAANHKTYATLTINVIDVNDVPPKLYMPRESPRLVEEVENNTEVKVSISADDVDTNAELMFSIDWSNTRAQKSSVDVDESHYRGHLSISTEWPDKEKNKTYAVGKLIVTGRIDYEAFDVMFLTISVTDEKTEHNDDTTSASLTLYIEDINDNWPIFDDPIEAMDVIENQIKDAMIGSVTATDADGRNYSRISYSIEPINGTKNDLVVINEVTGVIRVGLDKGIDAEEYEYIYYNVTATDGENSNSTIIKIYVNDTNDEQPYLSGEQFITTYYLREKSPSGTPIVTIRGKDDDRTSPFNNVSYLINGNYSAPMQYFSLGKFNGSLVVNLTDGYILDRDYGPSEFTLNLKLRDNYLVDYVTSYSNAYDFTVMVILEDINDKDPVLPDMGEPAVSVTENTKKGEQILTIKAKDDDDPTTNNTKVFYTIKNISPADEGNVVPEENYKNLFIVETRNESDAYIFANYDLKGYYGRWKIELYVQDRGTDPGPRNNTRTYVVQVKDFNYNPPEIKFPTSKPLALNKEQRLHEQLRLYDDQLLNDFTATDKDHGDSGYVTFNLTSTTGDHESFELAKIDTNVVQLRLAKMIDVEAKYNYTMTLVATDGGDPPRPDTREFTLIFVTMSGPKFDVNEWTVWIKENKTGLNDSTLIPAANDLLGEADIYYFFKPDEKDTKYFALDKSSRNLTVINELDREKQEIMIIPVIATTNDDEPPKYPQDHAILNITVIVLDVNDNSPIFESKIYRAGVAKEDPLNKVVLTVKATDVDLNDTLTYDIIPNSIKTSHSSLEEINNPFSIDPDNGDLILKFTVTSNMEGYFEFDIIVHDAVEHDDKTAARVYVVPQSSRVVFTFSNLASYVQEKKMFIIESFTTAFGYLCNIDDIKSTVDANDRIIDNSTTLTTHFISSKDNLPIESDAIILASSDLQTITSLKATLLKEFLYLVAVPTGSSTSASDVQQTVHWILVSLTCFFFLCSITLLIVYIVRVRRLNQRLDKLAITKYGSQESGLDRAGVVPTTNQFALAGSNPIWKTPEKSIDDNVSQGSGDSDLIGIEDNPDFGYVNDAMMNDEKWENARRGSVNPIFANHQVTSGSLFDRVSQHPEDEKKNIHNIY